MTEFVHGGKYLDKLGRLGTKPGLERIAELLRRLGDPQRRFRSVHIAGSNGKGSTAAYLAAALQYAGLRVGLFTSPHLERYNERIRVDGEPISDEALDALVERVRPLAAAVAESHGAPTEFEVGTAIAFAHFASEAVDVAVIETGLGGRLDATNVIDPLLVVITPITLDHTEMLGSSVRAVAGEKAGIIKGGRPVVIAPQPVEALDVLHARAMEVGADPVLVQREESPSPPARTHYFTPLAWNAEGGTVRLTYADGGGATYRVRMLGAHQLENAAVSAAAARELAATFPELTDDAVRQALRTTIFPGRLEVLGIDPILLLDGAHNASGAQRLAAALKDLFPGRPITLVCGISKDKPARDILAHLVPVADRIIATEPTSTRSGCWSAGEIVSLAQALGHERALAAPEPRSALRHATEDTDVNGVVCMTGSLYLVGEARAALATRPSP